MTPQEGVHLIQLLKRMGQFSCLVMLVLSALTLQAQTIGGAAGFSFLNLPQTPLAAAVGGKNISFQSELGLAVYNPALLQKDFTQKLQSAFTAVSGGVKAFGLTGALYSEKWSTTFAGHIFFVDYGTLPQTDASGNRLGTFRPVDYVVQASASRTYLQNWRYGATLKFIQSAYGLYRSNGVAVDVGVNFLTNSKLISASFLVRNMGVQLKSFAGEKEELPFDLLMGVTHRLEKAPFGFSLTVQGLHRQRLSYKDPSAPISTFTNVVHHLIGAMHVYAGSTLEAHIGYNALQRYDLSNDEESNGLTGLSAGLRIKLKRVEVLYGYSAYQRGVVQHQLGITASLKNLTALPE